MLVQTRGDRRDSLYIIFSAVLLMGLTISLLFNYGIVAYTSLLSWFVVTIIYITGGK